MQNPSFRLGFLLFLLAWTQVHLVYAGSSTEFSPLTTVFTPAPECTSITIVHVQRSVGVYTGCVGEDPTCCPPTGRANNTYSPGLCPSGYVTSDAHLGWDRLGMETEVWEATCVPSGVSTCTRRWAVVPQLPIGGENTICPRQYTSALPSLTTPLTASLFYYGDWGGGTAYPGIPEVRTTTVVESTWPTLTPATTTPRMVLASHLVIRWREEEFSSGSYVEKTRSSDVGGETSGVERSRLGDGPHTSTPPMKVPLQTTSSPSSSSTNSPSSSTDSPPPQSKRLGTGRVVASAVGSLVGCSAIAIGLLLYRAHRKRNGSSSAIELDDRQPVGCRVLYEGQDMIQPKADIVFVHGLRGHRMRTWTKDGCCWPADLLPKHLPGVRIMTIGYDASVARLFGRPSGNNINKHAASLLMDLQQNRSIENANRPIIFVAHSLGGIVVKDALRKARDNSDNSNNYHSIFNATQGIIFLGTPHHGSSYASLGRRFARILRFISRDINVGLLRSIEEDSEILERISEDFRVTLARKDIQVCSFVEELSMGSFLDPVVLPKSGYIGVDREIRGTIHANHRDMCRFKDARDPGFIRIVNVIFEMVAAAIHSDQLSNRNSDLLDPDQFEEENESGIGYLGEEEVGRDPYLQSPEPSLSRDRL